MTVCNMSIEAGAKAGLIAPDETTFAYLEGRAHAPTGAAWDEAVADWRTLRHRRRTPPSTRRSSSTPPRSSRTSPGAPTPARSRRSPSAVPDPSSFGDPVERDAAERALEYMGLTAGTPLQARSASTPSSSARAPTAASRTCGPWPTVAEGRRVASGIRTLVVPGSWQVKAQAEAEGLDRILVEAGFDWRDPGCSMCLAMNPDKLAARRALAPRPATATSRAARAGAGAPTSSPPPSPPPRPSPATSPPPTTSGRAGARHGTRPHRHRHRRPARPLRRRHRPDHPVRLAEAGRAHRLREGPLLGVARRPRLRAQPARARRRHHPPGRPQLRHRLVPRARRVGHPAVRLQGGGVAPVRRHLPQQLHQERPGARGGRRAEVGEQLLARGRRPTRRWRSPSTSSAARSRRPAHRPRRRVPARRRRPATGSSRASTTSA